MWRADKKLVAHSILLSLPTVAVVAFCIRFLVVDVPKMVRDEESRVLAVTERAAKAMREDPALADFTWERGRGVVSGAAEYGDYPADMSWKDWRPKSGTKRRDMWGWRDFEGGRLVWARGVGKQDGNRVYLRHTNIEERDYATVFYVFGVVFLVVLVGITAFGIRYFARYVKARDDFMAATAHDLTTPLVAMRYMIGRDDGEASNLNERMLRLVGNIKDFMRLGGRRPPPAREQFDVVKTYREAYLLFREDFRDLFDGCDVEVEFADGASEESGLAAVGDETMTMQILWNLLGNDLKYAAPYGGVKVVFSRRGGFARVEFVDEGKGMRPGEMRRAFNRYYRAMTVLESGKGGFGIGLCTAREFAEAMGGSLAVRANEPRGCVFTLELPSP